MKQTVASKNSNKETSKVITLPLVFKKLNEKQKRLENKNNQAKTNICTWTKMFDSSASSR